MKSAKIIFSISVLLLLLYIIALSLKFSSIQETVPIHYSSEGADGFGNKIFLWLEVGLNAILLMLISLPIFFPKKMFRKEEGYLETSFEIAIKNRQIFLSVVSVMVTLVFCIPSLIKFIL
ncbi:hypothetical protein SAMN05443633_10686 [Chryseobacterium arachidis]|uniref:DUF1648 domain-containing protein n=1 Tax=Chryseobacterium arachidis TaxID=1416778 RepID=A0A1M5E2R7_9FLAO|nr:hypothetical protein [Chryseobacterium arachidis]SHF73558.1 hypothetical protein SAMN05443633_10686 [Chryseobacterium arachidis]